MKALLSSLLKKYNCPKNLENAAKQIALKSGHELSFDSIKQILSLNSILDKLGNGRSLTKQGINTVCVIGDGYAFFSKLLKFIEPDIKVISVNLGRTLFFDVLYSKSCLPDENPILLRNPDDIDSDASKHGLTFIEAEKYNLLKNQNVDLFINIASMQEMNPDVIASYFEYMRSSKQSPCYFYCCNRLKKELPDGQTFEFMNYPWSENDTILMDEICPWYDKFPSLRPPFWHSFDGLTQHRLVKLK